MLTNWPIILRDDIPIPGKKPFLNATQLYSYLTPMPTPIPPAVTKSIKFKYVDSRFMNWYHKPK